MIFLNQQNCTTFVVKITLLMRFRFFPKAIIIFLGAILLWNCSSTKHVPAGKYLVDEVSINIEDTKEVSSSDLYNYLRQVPNHRIGVVQHRF